MTLFLLMFSITKNVKCPIITKSMFALALLIISSRSNAIDESIANTIMKSVRKELKPMLDGLSANFSTFASKFETGQTIYEIISKISPTYDIESLKFNITETLDLILLNTTREFLISLGGNNTIIDNVILASRYLSPETKLSTLMKELLGESESLISSIIPIVPNIIDASEMDGIFDFLNVDKDSAKGVVVTICKNYKTVKLSEVAELIGIKFDVIGKFFATLKTQLSQDTSKPLFAFIGDLGFPRIDIVNQTLNMIANILYGNPFYVDDTINTLKENIPIIIESSISFIQDVVGQAFQDLIPVISVLLDFRKYPFEYRLDSLSNTISNIINDPLIGQVIPSDISKQLKYFLKQIDDIKNYGIHLDIPNLTVDMNEIQNIVKSFINNESALISTAIHTFVSSNSTIYYLFDLIDSLTKPTGSIHDFISSLCGLIGGESIANSFENVMNIITNPDVTIIDEVSKPTFDKIDNTLRTLFGNDKAYVHSSIVDLLAEFLKTIPGYGALGGIIGIIKMGYSVHYILAKLYNLFDDNSSVFKVVDDFLDSNFQSDIANFHKIIYPFNKIANNIGINPYLPPIVPQLLQNYTDLFNGSNLLSLEAIVRPLTPYSKVFTHNCDLLYREFAAKDVKPPGVFNSLDKTYVDLRATIYKILDWSKSTKLSVQDVLNSIVAEASNDPNVVSLKDVLPINQFFNSMVQISKRNKDGTLSILQQFKDILNYNATTLINIGIFADQIVNSANFSTRRVVKYLTKTNISMIFDQSFDILSEVASEENISLKSINNFGIGFARDVGQIPIRIKKPSYNPSIVKSLGVEMSKAPEELMNDNTKTRDNKKKPNIPLIVGIAAGAVVLFIIIAVISNTLKKRQQGDVKQTEDSDELPMPNNEAKDETPSYV